MATTDEDAWQEVYKAAVAAVFSAWQLVVWERSATHHLRAVGQMPASSGRQTVMKQQAKLGAQRVLTLVGLLERQQMALNGSRAQVIVRGRWGDAVVDGTLSLLRGRAARSAARRLFAQWASRAAAVCRARRLGAHCRTRRLHTRRRLVFCEWRGLVRRRSAAPPLLPLLPLLPPPPAPLLVCAAAGDACADSALFAVHSLCSDTVATSHTVPRAGAAAAAVPDHCGCSAAAARLPAGRRQRQRRAPSRGSVRQLGSILRWQ